MPMKGVILDRLAERTQGYVGADIEAVCREAGMLALRDDLKAKEVKMKNFDKALNDVQPSVTKDIKKTYEEIKTQFKSARANEMKEVPSYMG